VQSRPPLHPCHSSNPQRVASLASSRKGHAIADEEVAAAFQPPAPAALLDEDRIEALEVHLPGNLYNFGKMRHRMNSSNGVICWNN
jgi:hypothetical protein